MPMEVELMNNPYDNKFQHHLARRRIMQVCLDSIDTNANGQNLKSLQRRFEERKTFNNGNPVLNSINS